MIKNNQDYFNNEMGPAEQIDRMINYSMQSYKKNDVDEESENASSCENIAGSSDDDTKAVQRISSNQKASRF